MIDKPMDGCWNDYDVNDIVKPLAPTPVSLWRTRWRKNYHKKSRFIFSASLSWLLFARQF